MRPVTPFMMMPSRTVSTFNLPETEVRCRSSRKPRCDRWPRRQRCQRGPVGLGARAEARLVARAQSYDSIAYRQTDIAPVVAVEVRMRSEEGLLLGRAGPLAREAVDVVMTIALDMRESE